MATLIHPDGTEREVSPADKQFSLDELYALVGCEMVECVGLADGRTMWLDEEGKLGDGGPKPRNASATALLMAAGGMRGDYIAGNALVTTEAEAD